MQKNTLFFFISTSVFLWHLVAAASSYIQIGQKANGIVRICLTILNAKKKATLKKKINLVMVIILATIVAFLVGNTMIVRLENALKESASSKLFV